jgi:hypothetical protein
MDIMKNLLLLIFIFSLTIGLNNSASASCVYSQKLAIEDFDMGNMLTWATSSETDNKAFEIEKSVDGVTFTKIGKVKGSGSVTEVKSYRFLDVSATQGQNFYRLKQIDLDGSFHLSDIIAVNKETANNFTVVAMTPPAENENIFEVTINALSEDELDYKIFDMEGNLIYTQKQKLKKGINVITVDLTQVRDESSSDGFAGNNELLGDKVGYRVSLEGINEAEMLTIAPRNKNVSKDTKKDDN